MNRHLPVVAVLAATAVLLLTGCGGGGDSPKASDKIPGADQNNKKSAEPSVTPSDDVPRPTIKVPSDLTYSFEWAKTGDKDKDAVLSDAEQYIKAVDMAIAEQEPLNEAYRFYSEGTAAAGSQKFIQEFVDHEDRITGTKRFYQAQLDIKDKGTASLVYCEDQSKAYNKSLKTGKVDKTSPSNNDFVIYSSRLRVNNQGVWVTEELTSQRGSSACQP